MSRDRKNDIHYIINLNYVSAWCPMEMFSDAGNFSLELGNISVYILIQSSLLISLQQNFRSTEERTYWWIRCVSLSCTCGFSGCVKNLDYRPFYFFCWLLFQNQHFNLFPVFFLQPERIDPSASRQGYDVRSDVWSLGITLVSRNSTNETAATKQMNRIKMKYVSGIQF